MIGKFKEFEAIACAVEAITCLIHQDEEITVKKFTEQIELLKYWDDYAELPHWTDDLPPENEFEIQDY